jgi:hypothetical protein
VEIHNIVGAVRVAVPKGPPAARRVGDKSVVGVLGIKMAVIMTGRSKIGGCRISNAHRQVNTD